MEVLAISFLSLWPILLGVFELVTAGFLALLLSLMGVALGLAAS